MSEPILNATLIQRRDLSEELAIVRVRPDAGVPAFRPGQFCTLGLPAAPEDVPPAIVQPDRPTRPRMVRRAYSIASSAHERDCVELYVVLVQHGRFTEKLWTLHAGDRLFMDHRINGEFTIDGMPENKDLVAIATGTGLAPFVSMLRSYGGQGRWRRFVLIHGARFACDLGYCDELRKMAAQDGSIIYVPSVTREPGDSEWTGVRGRVQTVLEPSTYQRLVGAPLDREHCHVFLCGNPDMIKGVQAQLHEHGFVTRTRDTPEGNIHFERYW